MRRSHAQARLLGFCCRVTARRALPARLCATGCPASRLRQGKDWSGRQSEAVVSRSIIEAQIQSLRLKLSAAYTAYRSWVDALTEARRRERFVGFASEGIRFRDVDGRCEPLERADWLGFARCAGRTSLAQSRPRAGASTSPRRAASAYEDVATHNELYRSWLSS